MKSTILKISLAYCFLFIFGVGQTMQAQTLADELQARLEGKDKLEDIMAEVDAFYAPLSEEAQNGKEGIPKLKFWNRWAYYWSSRLGPDGEFVNINKLMYEETQKRVARRGGRQAIAGDWEFIGATESTFAGTNGVLNGLGRVDRIAFHPTNGNIFYVGTPAGGLWKTTDGGATWEAKTDYLGSMGISGIVVDAVSPNTIYILTGDGDSSNPNYFVSIFGYIRKSIGVLKSTNGGDTWSSVGGFPGITDPYYGYALVQKPGSPGTLYAATTQGLFKSTNSGASWVLARAGGNHYDVAFNSTGTQLYTCDNTNFYRSTNQTTNTWAATTYSGGSPLANGRKAIGVTPVSSATVYLLCGGYVGAGQFSGLYKSTNSGVTMVRQATTPNILGQNGADDGEQSIYDHCIAVSPTNSSTAVTGGLTVWRTTNSGVSFTNIHPYWGNPAPQFSVHPDIHALKYNPVNGKLYVCHDGGVNVSSNNGTTFTDISKGIEVTQLYHMAAARDIEYRLALGAQDNGVKYRPSATKDFQHVSSGDGFYPSFVAGSDDEFYITINSGASRFNMTTNSSSGVSPSGGFYKVIEAHPTDPNIVFCGADVIYKSTNKGASWTDTGGEGFWSIAFAPSDPTVMYAAGRGSFGPGSDGKIYKSTDSGDSWTDLTSNPGLASGFTKITDIAVHPTNPNEVWITFGGFNVNQKVLFSLNGGANWLQGVNSPSIPNIPVNCVARTSSHVFVGTDNGVYYRLNGSATFFDMSDNMPNVPVTELLLDEDTGTLMAATFGRGAWQFPYCINTLNVTAPLEGVLDYSANNTMTSTSVISDDADNDIQLKAGTEVKLLPGFHAKAGGKTEIKLGSCDDNDLPN
jgi:photosystem II stability/assembly factor-like uncharacterized protein